MAFTAAYFHSPSHIDQKNIKILNVYRELWQKTHQEKPP